MVHEMQKKEKGKLEKAVEVRKMAGRGRPPVAPPRKLQLQQTKVNLPGLFSGFQMTIPAIS